MFTVQYDMERPQVNAISYGLFRDLILERTGMYFSRRRQDDLIRSVRAAAERSGFEDMEEFYRFLYVSRTESRAWEELIQMLIVSETYFFRDQPQFEALRQHILSDLIRRHRDDRRLRIWSAGCATGEEPYSIAILLSMLLPDIAQWNVFILATDINRQNLSKAEKGIYRETSFRQTDPVIRERYFTPRDGVSEVKPQVREMVTFAYLNLVEDVYPSLTTNTNAMDLILCRNVAIYLQENLLREMALRFHRCLAPDGWFIVGAAEAGSSLCDPFIFLNYPGAILYRKGVAPPHQLGPPVRELLREAPPAPLSYKPPDLPLFQTEPAPAPLQVSPQPAPAPSDPADLYREGLAMMRKGYYEGAMEKFQTLIGMKRDFIPAYCQMARAHANRGRLREAVSWCEKAVKLNPLLAEAYYILALIRQEEGDDDEALAQLKKALYLEPDFVLAHFSLSGIYGRAGRREEALRHRSQSLRLGAKMPPDEIMPGSDGLTAARLLTMIREMR